MEAVFEKYEKYKDSGVEWIGEIPEHWENIKLKFISFIVGGSTPSTNNDKYWDGEINWVTTDDLGKLKKKYIESSRRKISNDGLESIGNKMAPANSIVISSRAPIGHLGVLNIEATTNQGCKSITPNSKLNSDFLYYYLLSAKEDLKKIGKGSTFTEISTQDVKDYKIVLPNIPEQTPIANFLDRKTTQIDDLIAKKEKLITLLDEKRQATINHAVTKGLDPIAKLEDSEVEWIGQIPEHWRLTKLKYIKSKKRNAFVDGPFGSNLKTEHFIDNGDVYVIDSGYITSGEFLNHKEFRTISNYHFETVRRSECKEGDIIISKIGANFGMSGILPKLNKQSVVSGNSLKLTVNLIEYDLKFIHYVLLNLKASGVIDNLVRGSAQPALSLALLNSLEMVTSPDKMEQTQIANFLDHKTKQIDDLKALTQTEIDKLREYRHTLISNAVTGKIDVRNTT